MSRTQTNSEGAYKLAVYSGETMSGKCRKIHCSYLKRLFLINRKVADSDDGKWAFEIAYKIYSTMGNQDVRGCDPLSTF